MNFALVVSLPIRVDYLREAPPQVVADSRKPIQTESLLASPKKDMRCVHWMKGVSEGMRSFSEVVEGQGGWETREVNP